MFAVFKTGGKQYRVAANDKLLIERLKGEPGDQITFGEVLMITNGDQIDIGAPLVSGATVVAEIDKHARGPHIIIFKKRRRKHYRRRNGHRQDLTSVVITDILLGGAKPAPKPKAEKPAAVAPVAATPEKAAPAASPAPAAATAVAKPAAKAAAPATASNDISLIGGIGPKIEKGLNDLGVTTLQQISIWTPEDVERVETALKQKGRVAREEWIEQAKELLAGQPPRAKTDRARKEQE